MGGNLFKDKGGRRITNEEMVLLEQTISLVLKSHNLDYFIPVGECDKPDHGDLDVIVCGNKSDIVPVIQDLSIPDHLINRNGQCVSVLFGTAQVDFIVPGQAYYQTTCNYMRFGDFSNIIGRILHKLGIKLGHKGLSLVIRHKERSDHILKEIELSHRYEDALEILGLDVDTYNRGFDTLEDIFEYVSTSKFFDPEIYAFENRSYTSRVRDKKRTTYNGFLKWIEQHPEKKKYSFPDKNERGGYSIREPYYTDIVLKKWPWVEQIVNETIAQFEFSLRLKEKYNGHIVSEMTGLSGKELGAFMGKISVLMSDEIKQKIVDSSPNDAFAILQELVNAVTD